MSTVADPDTGQHELTTPEAQPEALTCPNCGAPADPGQLMCLECGSRLALGYQRRSSWRLPAAIIGFVLLLAGLGVGIAIAASNDNTPVASTAAATAPAPQSAPADSAPTTSTPAAAPTASTPTPAPPAASTGTASTPTPAPTTTGTAATPAPATTAAGWPPGKSAFTVILASLPAKADADAKLKAAQAAGITTASVLHSDDFPTLRPGYWVVFDGQFSTIDQANAQAAGDRGKPGFADAYSRFVSKDANAKP